MAKVRKRVFYKIAALCFTAVLFFSLAEKNVFYAISGEPQVSCAAYVIMDADTGQVLLEKNADTRMYPASITKIITVGLAMEKANGQLDDTLTVSEEAVFPLVGTGSSHIALQPGEIVCLEDILYGTQMASANDGANVLAEYFGGTIENGVELMNKKCEDLGLQNTHFANPHGLMDTDHYTSARDMALITKWALLQPGFEEVFCRTETWTMEPTNLQSEQRAFGSSDWMKVGLINYREYARGSKSGYHDQAGQTLVTLCEQDGLRLIGVLLNDISKSYKFADACALMDYCFENFHKQWVTPDEHSETAALIAGGDEIGTVHLSSVKMQIVLHDSIKSPELTYSFTDTDQYIIGKDCDALQTVHINGNGFQSSSEISVPLQPTDAGTVLRQLEAKSLPRVKENNKGLYGFVAAAFAGAFVIVMLLKYSKNANKAAKGLSEIDQITLINHKWLPAESAVVRAEESPKQIKAVYRKNNRKNARR